jgi:hypothetical protein
VSSAIDKKSDGTVPIAVAFALAALLIHLLTNGRYGYFRDELYYLACGDHLDWGYVDHAPLIALIARTGRALFGDSLHAIRFFAALASPALILLTGLIARELGGGRFAVALACLCVLVAPIWLILHTFLSMNAFEPLFWMGCAYVLLLVIKRDNPKLLVWFGVLAGLGLENKHSMLFFGFALCAGLLFTKDRRLFLSPWLWLAAAIAVLLFLPNLIWQYQHHWPTIEDLSNVRKMHKNVELSPIEFIGQQILIMQPASALVWIPGLWFLLFDRIGQRYRALGVSFVVILGLMLALKGKNYYLAPAYPIMFAAGAVLWERGRAWVKVSLPAFIAVTGILFAPLTLPVLPVDALIRWQEIIHVSPPKTEVAHSGALPQHFGDMFGWPEMVATVADVYQNLPAADQAKTAILAGNYGEAGAIDFFGPRYGLPKAISRHQTYYLWGPRQYTGEIMILLQSNRADAEQYCTTVESGPELNHPYAMAEEHYQILICRGLKMPLPQLWPRLKLWN